MRGGEKTANYEHRTKNGNSAGRCIVAHSCPVMNEELNRGSGGREEVGFVQEMHRILLSVGTKPLSLIIP